MQDKVKKLNNKMSCHKKRMPESARLLAILSECGELAKEILKNSKYGTQPFELTDNFKMEYGDVLYNFLCLANEVNIDANECLDIALAKYEKRKKEKNDLSSGK